jgi:hypothetical protein
MKRMTVLQAGTLKWLLIVAIAFLLLMSLGACTLRDIRGPSPQEKAENAAKIAKAKRAALEEIANEATVGESTATFEMYTGANHVKGSGGYFVLGPRDLPLLTDVFCAKRGVQVIGTPSLVQSNDLWSYYSVYFEKVR